jgi:hypothetical protein
VELAIIAFGFALAGGFVGKAKGFSFWLWFAICAIPPFFPQLLVALLYRNDNAVARRACPTCGKVVHIHDALCTRCGTELDFPEEDEVLEPAGATPGSP